MRRGPVLPSRLGLALAVGLVLAACSPQQLRSQQLAVTGQDGDKTIAGTEVVNTYTPLAVAGAAGDTTITVADAAGFAADDLVLVVASQGATITTSDTAAYGSVSILGQAGQHEFWQLKAVDVGTNTLTLNPACSVAGLSAAYPLSSQTQVIRVPQYRNLTVPFAATLTGQPWNGSTGGYVVVHVEDTAIIDGVLQADSIGFRGGALSPASSTLADDEPSYRNTLHTGGEKGESIAGSPSDYDALFFGRYGRGAPANGGGGGNGYLSGGGGGAGVDAVSPTAYSGQGTMPTTVAGASAWSLDPGAATAGGPGGGRGGYSLSAVDLDATSVGPNNNLWGANDRSERGGLGGHSLPVASKLLLGGGGGAGSYDGVATTQSGGRGGGVVYLMANVVAGAGTVRADGQDGASGKLEGTGNALTIATGGGSGGGGGGGIVIVRASGAAGITFGARGGTGGHSVNAGTFALGVDAANGPGGGGAGGGVVLGTGVVPTTTPDVRGGAGGLSMAPAANEFPSNGASTGNVGLVQNSVTQSSPPRACLPADVQVTLADSSDPVETGSGFAYTATVKNNGPNAAYDVSVVITAPASVTTGGVTASGWSCAQAGQTLTCTRTLLAANASSVINWSMVAPGAETTLNASATVSSREDAAAGNNTDSESTVVQLPQTDLSLALTSIADTASNEPFTYSMKVTNGGPRTAPSVNVVNTLPAGVTYQSTSSAGWTCVAAGSTVTCTRGSLANGASSTVDIQALAPSLATSTTLSDHATVLLASSGAHDPNATNDTAASDVIVHPVDLSITKADAADPVGTGASITYTLTVINSAVVSAHNVVVQDPLPAGTSFVSASGTGWTCSLVAGVIGCTRTTAFANPTATPAITVVLTAPNIAGMVSNTASVSASATDPATANNSAVQTTAVVPPSPGSADLSVTLAADTASVPIGTPVSYTVSVGNDGPDPATNAQVQIVFPSDVSLGSATGEGWTCITASSSITCTPTGKLALGAAADIAISTTAPMQAGVVSVTATVGSTTPDPTVANDHATAEVQVVDPAVQNDPPTLIVPSTLSTNESVPITLSDTNAPQVTDPDAGSDDVELHVDASRGAFTLAITDGLTFVAGDGILDAHLVVRGPQSALNAALASSVYTPDPGFFGDATLAFLVDDLGHSGMGGPQQAATTIDIAVAFIDSPPIARDDEATVSSDRTSSILVLANDDSGDPGQALSLASATQPQHGTVAIVGHTIRYTPAQKYLGDDAFDYVCSDGNSTGTAHVVMHVVPDTSPPTPTFLSGGGVGCAYASSRSPAPALLFVLLSVGISWRPRSRGRRPG